MQTTTYPADVAPDDWAVADAERAAGVTPSELDYCRAILEAYAPGRLVVDMGRGFGRRAIGLARAGFDITGVGLSPRAVAEARRLSNEAGVDVPVEVVDIRAAGAWPLAEFDAAIYVDGFGRGPDAEQRRFLRRLRHHLAPNGILVLAVPNAFRSVADLEPADVRVGDVNYRVRCRYDPLSGQTVESLQVSVPGEPDRRIERHVRLYTPVELVSMVREAGYQVIASHGDFEVGCSASQDSRQVQVVARQFPGPPASLAVTHWRTPPDYQFELRYAPDETAWVDPSPDELWGELIDAERRPGADAAGYYPVDDPYGAERAASVVAAHFACAVPHHLLTFGAGVTSLLRDLSGLADGGRIFAGRIGHPDLAAWAMSTGSEIRLIDSAANPHRLIHEIAAGRPSLVILDRPTVLGELLSRDDLAAVGEAAERVGAIMVVDESAASYLGPAGSAIPLIHRLDNLVVLRGFTKAYSRGGIRVGFAVASGALGPRVRELVPPLQVSELSFRASLRLLEAGDIFSRLRTRIAETKPLAVALFAALGLEVMPGHPSLPWLLVHDKGQTATHLLGHRGIRGLRLVPSPASPEDSLDVLQLFVPLSDDRVGTLRRLLAVANN